MTSYRRRRSCLTVPGSSERMVRKAVGLSADEIVLDLEDGVAHSEKDAARRLVVEAIGSGIFGDRTLAVRVNAIGSPWCHADIIALCAVAAPALTLVVPKVESAADLGFIDRLLDGLEAEARRPAPIGVQALIETASGLTNIASIAQASVRLEAMILGYADLASSLGRATAAETSWLFAQETLLVTARANGLQPIDGPALSVGAEAGLERVARNAAALGFEGKWAIHPSHLPVLNAAFSPTAEAVSQARALLARLDNVQAAGAGAVAHEGEMIDEAMRLGALRILARAGDTPSP
jgi:citrate lyase subunit beta/citryl-CoA lyase